MDTFRPDSMKTPSPLGTQIYPKNDPVLNCYNRLNKTFSNHKKKSCTERNKHDNGTLKIQHAILNVHHEILRVVYIQGFLAVYIGYR